MKQKRWFYAVNGIAAMLVLGFFNAWSVFIGPLEVEFGWTRAQISMTFTIAMVFFCLGGVAGGIITSKKSPRYTMTLTAVFLLLGFSGASRVMTLSGMYLFYGVICGFGNGLGYNAILATMTKWFPERVGFISGAMMMSCGLGGMLIGQTTSTLLTYTGGWRPTFLVFAVSYFIIILACSRLTVLPSVGFVKSVRLRESATNKREIYEDITPGQMLKEPNYWFFLVWTIMLQATGLGLIGHASPIAVELGATVTAAAFAMGLISIFNGIVRPIYGFLFDAIGRRKAMLIINLLFVLATSILIYALKIKSLPVLIIGYIVMGLCFGGVPVTNSAFVSSFFGSKYYAINFSLVNMSLIIASFIGPYWSGVLRTSSGSYLSTLFTMFGFVLTSLVFSLFIRKSDRKLSPRCVQKREQGVYK